MQSPLQLKGCLGLMQIIAEFFDAFKRAQQFPKGKRLINTTVLIKDIVSFVVDAALCERI